MHRVALGMLLAQAAANIVQLKPGDNIQAAVDANPEGTTFLLAAGVYRQQSVRPKSFQQFIGPSSRSTLQSRWSDIYLRHIYHSVVDASPSAVLNGALLLPDATHDPITGLYVIAGLQNLSTLNHGPCDSAHGACGFTQDLFLNDAQLFRAANLSQVTPGSMSWYLAYEDVTKPITNGTAYLGVDPSTRWPAELSVTPSAIAGNVDGIVIANLTFEKYACPAQLGAVHAGASNNEDGGWHISGCEFRYNHGRGIDIQYNAAVVNSFLHHNGQLGAGGNNGSLVHSEVSFNNQAGFETAWEAGGAKFVNEIGTLTVSQNYVHDNYGDGLWTDIGSSNVYYTDNQLFNNSGAGVSHEISYFAYIAGNVASGNGGGFDVWLWGAQIQVQNSRDVIVYNNSVWIDASRNMSNAIAIIQQDRGSEWPLAVNNTVTSNRITFQSCGGNVGEVADHNLTVLATGNNTFDYNTYVMYDQKGSARQHWWWTIQNASGDGQNMLFSFANFQQVAKQEPHGQIVNGQNVCP